MQQPKYKRTMQPVVVTKQGELIKLSRVLSQSHNFNRPPAYQFIFRTREAEAIIKRVANLINMKVTLEPLPEIEQEEPKAGKYLNVSAINEKLKELYLLDYVLVGRKTDGFILYMIPTKPKHFVDGLRKRIHEEFDQFANIEIKDEPIGKAVALDE